MKANLVIKDYLKVAGAAIEAAKNEQAKQGQCPKISAGCLGKLEKIAAAVVEAANNELAKQGQPKIRPGRETSGDLPGRS